MQNSNPVQACTALHDQRDDPEPIMSRNTTTQVEKGTRLRALHEGPGAFIIANAWDAGSARILSDVGFQALATSSGASAGLLGRRDGRVTRNEALGQAR